VSRVCPRETQLVGLHTYLKRNSSQPHNFEVRDPSLTISRCQNFVVCGEEHIISVLLGYRRSYRDQRGAIGLKVAQNFQNFVERNISYQFL
jgi:hypothetical protein